MKMALVLLFCFLLLFTLICIFLTVIGILTYFQIFFHTEAKPNFPWIKLIITVILIGITAICGSYIWG